MTAIVAFVALLHWLACVVLLRWTRASQHTGWRSVDHPRRQRCRLLRLPLRSDPLTTEACRNPCLTDCEIEEMMC